MNTLKYNNQLTIKDVNPKNTPNNDEAVKELEKIKEIEKNIDTENLGYNATQYTYSFENFRTIKTFVRLIYEGKITVEEADGHHKDLLVQIMNFKKNKKPRKKKKRAKENVLKKLSKIFFVGEGRGRGSREKLLRLLKGKYFR